MSLFSEKHIDYANEVSAALREAGVRVEMDTSDDTIGKKLRTHRAMRPAYLLILGDEEANNGTVSYMGPDREQVNGVATADFVASIQAEISSRSA